MIKIIQDNEIFTLYEGNVKIFKPCVILGFENIEWGENVMIDHYFTIDARKQKVKIGSYTHISAYSSISGGGGVTMNDFSGIAQGSRLITSTDDFTDWGFGNPTVPLEYRNVKHGLITLGKFSIIGANSIVLIGVNIGEGAMVGANSNITKNLEPWGVYFGVNKKLMNRNREGVLENYKKFIENIKSKV